MRDIRSMPERDEDGQYVHRDDAYSCEECLHKGTNIRLWLESNRRGELRLHVQPEEFCRCTGLHAEEGHTIYVPA